MSQSKHPWTKVERNDEIQRLLALPKDQRPTLRSLGKKYSISHQRVAQIYERVAVSTSKRKKSKR